MRTTPLTEMLGFFRSLKGRGGGTLTADLKLAKHFAASPAELAHRFALSVAQFSPYHNPCQFFHAGRFPDGCDPLAAGPPWPTAAPGAPWPGAKAAAPVLPAADGPKVAPTFAFGGQIVGAEICYVDGAPDLSFRYVDRELDCLRESPGRRLDDGTPAAEAVVLDLLLENAADGMPILAEVKLREDKDPMYALVQALAAAAHLVTPSQRSRLARVYGLTPPTPLAGPHADIYLLFHEPPVKPKGTWVQILDLVRPLAAELTAHPAVATLLRRIVLIRSEISGGKLRFSLL